MTASTRVRSVPDVRDRLDGMIAEVCGDGRPTLVMREGKPAAVLQDIKEYERTRTMIVTLTRDLSAR